MKIETTIKITVGKKEIELTDVEAKQLQRELNNLFSNTTWTYPATKTYTDFPNYPITVTYTKDVT